MDLDKLRDELESDEGCRYEIYLDHLGYHTFGIGHLVIKGDPEYGKEPWTQVTGSRVKEAFAHDIVTVLSDCQKLYEDFYELPEEAQRVIANMMFNMGYTRLRKFRGMRRAVDGRHWKAAAIEMVDSRWYHQVPNRAKRLVERMKSI